MSNVLLKAPKYFILNVLKRSLLILDQLAADSFEEECRTVAYKYNFTCRAYRILVLCLIAFRARIRLFRLARGKP